MAALADPKAALSPTSESERIEVLDVLRGFALFGILLVNMIAFGQVMMAAATLPLDYETALDHVAGWGIRWLAEGKFYSLFSLLFGMGFTLQMMRAEAKGRRFVPVYLRRSLVLLVIGVLHGILFWVGDILAIYAVLGVLLLLFRHMRPRNLLIWAVVILLLPSLFMIGANLLLEFARQDPAAAAQIDAMFAESYAATAAEVERASAIYATGSYAEITAQRAIELVEMWLTTLFILPSIFAMFLVGACIGKSGILADLEGHRTLLVRLCIWGLGLGLPLNAVYATLIESLVRTEPSWPLVIAVITQAIGAPLLALGYMSGLALLWQRPAWRARLYRLAPLGRMALTNYLLQSLIATLIFYGYGLGLFGQVGIAAGVLITIAIYLVNYAVSHWWLGRYRFGPVEWLWRTLTYGRRQPMRRASYSTITV
ncbi:MAG: DUF418 domain-containing protein [Chloroflexota bacterium]|nr:DUF418 domain-containing protein [Chloroflexota bacterium]